MKPAIDGESYPHWVDLDQPNSDDPDDGFMGISDGEVEAAITTLRAEIEAKDAEMKRMAVELEVWRSGRLIIWHNNTCLEFNVSFNNRTRALVIVSRASTPSKPPLTRCVRRGEMDAKERCRRASQILIEKIGAPGPENVVETAERAASVITRQQKELDAWRARRLMVSYPRGYSTKPETYQLDGKKYDTIEAATDALMAEREE